MEVFFCSISCVVAMNIFGILQTCVKDIWLCLRVPMMSEFQSMKFENVFYVKNLKKIASCSAQSSHALLENIDTLETMIPHSESVAIPA